MLLRRGIHSRLNKLSMCDVAGSWIVTMTTITAKQQSIFSSRNARVFSLPSVVWRRSVDEDGRVVDASGISRDC